MLKLLILFSLIIGLTSGFITIEAKRSSVNELRETIDFFNFSSLTDIENYAKHRCEKEGKSKVVEQIKEARNDVKNCVENYVNVSQIVDELEQSKFVGKTDDVFKKYCDRYEPILECLLPVTDKLKTCMNPKEYRSFTEILDLVRGLKKFLCLGDGQRLAIFYLYNGTGCLRANSDVLNKCVNRTIGLNKKILSGNLLAYYTFLTEEEEACKAIDRLRTCVYQPLDANCEQSLIANIVDAALKHIKKQLPCYKLQNSRGNSLQLSFLMILLVTVNLIIILENSFVYF